MMIFYIILLGWTVVLVSGQRYAKAIPPPGLGFYPGHNDLSSIHQQGGGNKYTQVMPAKKPGGSNMFNVGYDLSFHNFNANKHALDNSNKKFENAEVITGKLKKNEKVRAPGAGAIRYTSSPIKTTNPIRKAVSRFPSQSDRFTYNTQQNIFKDVIKATRPERIQLSPDLKASYGTSSDQWQFEPGNVQRDFNHETALENSESFDFSNAHGKITFGDDNSPAASEPGSYAVNEREVQPSTSFNNVNIDAYIPKHLKGVKPLPLDVSLVKDPILTTTHKDPSKYGRVLPIHFDVSPIQTVMQQELGKLRSYTDNHPSNSDFRVYGKAEPVDPKQYGTDKRYANYNEENMYKMLAMRPPPISHKFRY